MDLGRQVTVIAQEVQEGFGHAVFCAKEWVDAEPFLLMLGDHLYASDSETSCTRQLLDVYDRVGHSVVGLKTSSIEELHNSGCVNGVWQGDSLLSVTEFYEKPPVEYARKHLHVDRMEEDLFLTVFGLYVLAPQIFDYLEEHITHNLRERGEFQLTPCLDTLRKEDNFSGYVLKGRRFDIGLPEAYRATVIDFRNA